MICAAKRVQKSTILTIACCSMPSPGSYCDWDPIGRKHGRVWRRNIRQCSVLATTTGCTGTLPEHRLTPKGPPSSTSATMGRRNRRFLAVWAVPAATYMGKCWNHDPAAVPAGFCRTLPHRPVGRSRDVCQSLHRGAAHAEQERVSETLMKVILAQPRGFCAGVVRAIEIVERALKKYGPTVYVRHEIVHNKFVVDSLKAKGAIFVEELSEVPQGAVTIFSAHGVAKSVVNEAAGRQLPVLDATCPLVTKVHNQGKRYVAQGRVLILVGHAGHPEVEGTLGQIDGPVVLAQSEEDVAALHISPTTPAAYVTKPTLSVDDTRGIIAGLERRYRNIVGPEIRDICYATQNRQSAVRELSHHVDVILVVGAKNSSNSNRLREIGAEAGIPSYLIADGSELAPEWVKDAQTIGITAGASAPEVLVEDVINTLRRLGEVEVSTLPGREEHIEFRLPRELAAG